MHRLIADCGILWFRQILPITTTSITLSVQTSSILATLDHDIDPDRRHILYPAPIHIGRKVWIGAGVIITKGVTIGDNSIVQCDRSRCAGKDSQRDLIEESGNGI